MVDSFAENQENDTTVEDTTVEDTTVEEGSTTRKGWVES